MAYTFDNLCMTPLYGVSHYAVRGFYEAFFRGEVVGTDNLPRTGPFIVAANHVSYLDPPFIGCQVPRQLRPFARRTLWAGGIVNWWLDGVGCIPVDRGSADVGAIRRVMQALDENLGLILFPEGTRSPTGQMQRPKSGVGLIACRTSVPVVPCRIFGAYEACRKGKILPRLGTSVSVVFGSPLLPANFDDPAAGKDRYELAAERIMQGIAALLPPEYAVI